MLLEKSENITYSEHDVIICGCDGSDKCILCNGTNKLIFLNGVFESFDDME